MEPFPQLIFFTFYYSYVDTHIYNVLRAVDCPLSDTNMVIIQTTTLFPVSKFVITQKELWATQGLHIQY